MKTQLLGAAAICGIALILTAAAARSEISEPDHVIYGTPTWYGAAMESGTVSLALEGDDTRIASYTLGSDSTAGNRFVLWVPMDTVDPRREATARYGDRALIYVDDEPAASVTIGEHGTVQLLDVDPEQFAAVPALSITDAALAEGDSGSTGAVFTVSLSLVTDVPVTVDWVTANGTADGEDASSCSGAGDYLAANGQLTIDPGDPSATITIEICGDVDAEADEDFYVDLLNPVNAVLLDPQGKGTILDDDTPPELVINNVTVTEPEAGSVDATFQVSLTHTWDQDVSFDYATADAASGSPAAAGYDYLATSDSGLITAGALSTTLTVEVLADVLDEDDEIFLVDLSNPANATILDGRGQGTIVDAAAFLVFLEAQQDGVAGVDGLAGAVAVAVSPDGEHLYAAGRSEDAIAVFDRDPSTGALSFLTVYTPDDFSHARAATFVGLDGVEDLIVSADGAHLYAASYLDDAVVVFERNTDSGDAANFGRLTLVEVELDGVDDIGDAGGTVDGLDGATALALSGDDEHLYVAGYDADAVAVFERDAADGSLSFVEVERDGIDDASDLGGLVDGLSQASAVAVSPDGESVYVAGFGDDAVAVFQRETDPGSGIKGRLSYLEVQKDGVGGVDGLAGATAVAVAPDGSDVGVHVYVAGQSDSAVAVFARDSADGSLSWLEVVRNGVGDVRGLEGASAVAVSADREVVYATGYSDDALVVLDRDDNSAGADYGRLSWIEVKRDDVGGVEGLFGATAVAVSPDDLAVYVAGNLDNAVAVFFRDLVPPDDPTVVSTSHTVSVWSNDPIIDLELSGAVDNAGGSGVAGYSYLFDQATGTLPDAAVDLAHLSDPHGISSAELSDGDDHYFHLRTCDHAQNCSTTVELGPFWIELTSPTAPDGVSSTSHEVGVSSLTEVIDMVWTTAGTDPGTPSSGLDGYSYVFNQSDTNTCNNDVDVGAVSGVSSVTLAPGTWYFHLCSVDVAGNTSDTITAGPYVIGADTVPPQVEVISSVAEPAGGEIVADSVISHGITQLLLRFSESMVDPSGSTETADVTNPANYLLVDPGDDATYDTTGCTLVDDDEEVSLADVVYDSATVTAALQLPAPESLPLGNYRLVVCATLEDEDGNLLDGDGDGTGGDDLVFSFQLDRSDLLLNPNLDADVDNWSPSSSAATSFSTDEAADALTSGSAQITRSVGEDLDFSISQCVNVSGAGPYDLTGMVRITESGGGDPGAADAFATATFYDDSSCGGAQIGSEESTNVVSDDTGGSWEALEVEITTTSDALSALVSFTVSLPVGEDFGFDAWFDSLLFATPDRVPPVDPTVWSTRCGAPATPPTAGPPTQV